MIMMKSVRTMNGPHDKSIGCLRVFAVVLILFAGLCWSCNQDPIFYDISSEVVLNNPKIPGGPSPIVVNDAGDKLYVSNGEIYVYEKPSPDARAYWRELPEQPPGGQTKALATTRDALYALTIGGNHLNSAKIYKLSLDSADSGDWIPIGNPSGYDKLQSVFGAGDYLFAGALSGDSAHAILYLEKGAGSLTCMADKTVSDSGADGLSELRGVVFFDGQYYMATAGNGIYRFASPADMTTGELALKTAEALPGSIDGGAYVGLIPVGSSVYGFTGSGQVWQGKAGGGGQLIRLFGDCYFTGALGIWENPEPGRTESFLLIGRGSKSYLSTYTYGYYELEIIGGELNIENGDLLSPGAAELSSVKNQSQYVTSLQKKPLNDIYQVPWTENNDERPIFASSQQDGLWSYRKNRDSDSMEWNIED
jgi:hypothetical protein